MFDTLSFDGMACTSEPMFGSLEGARRRCSGLEFPLMEQKYLNEFQLLLVSTSAILVDGFCASFQTNKEWSDDIW